MTHTPKFSPNTKITRNPEAIFTETDGDIVAMGIDDGEFYGINHVGADIWKALDDKSLTVTEIQTLLLERYDAEAEQIAKDVDVFIEEMEKLKMVFVEA